MAFGYPAGSGGITAFSGTLVTSLQFEGSDTSTTITDSTGTDTWTAAGNAQIDTAQAFVGSSSLLLDGTDDKITCDNVRTNHDHGANRLVHIACRPSGVSGTKTLIAKDNNSALGWVFDQVGADLRFGYRNGSGSVNPAFYVGSCLATDTWSEAWLFMTTNSVLAKVIRGANIYWGGCSLTSYSPATSTALTIGDRIGGGIGFIGHVDDVRVYVSGNVEDVLAGLEFPS
jgi:hypothetical protein